MLSSGVIDIHYIELLLKMCDLVLCLLSFVFGPKSPMLSMSKDVSSTDFLWQEPMSMLSLWLLPPQGFGPDGQNPRRHPRGPRVLGRKISQYQKKSRFFKNRARKVLPKSSQGLPKSSQGIAETSLGVEETLEGVWERSFCTRFLSGKGRVVIK